ncbi:MAG: ATP-binding cassette domain-containing protein, partial [Myxococcota bacterium]
MSRDAKTNGERPLLRVRGLSKHFPVRSGVFSTVGAWVKAVDDVSFDIDRREIFALVGESGCGKTTTGRSLLRLIEPTAGEVEFDGQDVLALSRGELRALRRRMQIIFQDPYGSLNPRMTVGGIIGE